MRPSMKYYEKSPKGKFIFSNNDCAIEITELDICG